ncbi:MAG: imidazoleglycerol-phosphate dehydratase HisB [Chloroflexota bacterium]|nr:MAG: imidazoleglycerol-phosphate dehydratase HisB [Chloroflexota bacterium]
MLQRHAALTRETGETRVSVDIDIDGRGAGQVDTGVGMLDHLLTAFAKHGRFDLAVKATGDIHVDDHHSVEDVGIALGRAFAQAIGEPRGIFRMGDALVPLDEALAQVAVDLGGRGYAVIEASFSEHGPGALSGHMITHFLETLAIEARMNLHARIISGANDHHKAEALFKALGRALDQATQIDPRIAGQVPSTKGVIET